MEIRRSLTVLLFLWMSSSVVSLSAQTPLARAEADSLLDNIRLRVSRLNNHDPELISLHYLFAGDLQKELRRFNDHTLPQLKSSLPPQDYYAVLDHYDRVSFYVRNVRDTLNLRRKQVDSLFYALAMNEMMYDNRQEAEYYANRALEYNRLNPDALLLKINLLYAKNQFDDCLELIHLLYNEAVLNREQEMQISDFTILFYDKLYATGDSLVKQGHAAEALEVFNILEQFCHNMPSNYCNEDYYKGILRSKTGVFNSYLAVAKAAVQRRNADMARLFWEYAVQYKEANQGEILDETLLHEVEAEVRKLQASPIDAVAEQPSESVEEPVEESAGAPVPQEQLYEDIREHEQKIDCERLLIEGIDYCYKEDYKKAFDILSKAKAMGTCENELLDRLLHSLNQILNE